MTRKHIFRFGQGAADGDASMRDLLGGKGANLAEMAMLGLNVPPGFTITTDVCAQFYHNDEKLPEYVLEAVRDALTEIEQYLGAKFGDKDRPLLVSVRSGSRASMPGMMDTVLNLGLNDVTVEGLASRTGDDRFAWDSYRRFIQMFGSVVLGVSHDHFEEALEAHKEETGKFEDTELDADDWRQVVSAYKTAVRLYTGDDFPQDAPEQLRRAIEAVFRSWHNPRAETYRRLNNIPTDWGTAVNVQSMVFGNLGDTSATGVLFTRDPSSGEKVICGEYLPNAQGEDVVAGIRTPRALHETQRKSRGDKRESLEVLMPEVWQSLIDVSEKLERHYRDMQDIEFTVQEGKLWLLQTRSGKRSGSAAIAIAVAMVEEGIIDRGAAINQIEPKMIDQLLHPVLSPMASDRVLTTGLPASPGAASGRIALSAAMAEQYRADDISSILVRAETNPDDIKGMNAASGVLTARGGMTSHAAVVARGMGRPCIAGAGELHLDAVECTVTVGDTVLREGDTITIDGSTGQVFVGKVTMAQPTLGDDFAQLMGWVDDVRKLRVRTNADTPDDLRAALRFGADGIGLCRTEHMFFSEDRILAVREMILAEDVNARAKALQKLKVMQTSDFKELFECLKGKPVTIRLLDPPLHEFLPHSETEVFDLADQLGIERGVIARRVSSLREANPMLGNRGCRIGIGYPEIYRMQVQAILESAALISDPVALEIMIPLVMNGKELIFLRDEVAEVAAGIAELFGKCPPYLLGTMIELPRAALCAGEISAHADFFSFGTNDLTQTTLGLSRDDSAPILTCYRERGILSDDPFASIDVDGVGALIRMACEAGRATKKSLKLGVCGEHAGDPASVQFFADIGLDYVSCSPYRVPIARLAAAQAALR